MFQLRRRPRHVVELLTTASRLYIGAIYPRHIELFVAMPRLWPNWQPASVFRGPLCCGCCLFELVNLNKRNTFLRFWGVSGGWLGKSLAKWGNIIPKTDVRTRERMDEDLTSESLLQWGSQELTIDRKLLISCLDARIQRAQRCRAVPRAVVIYIVFIVALLVRMPVEVSYEFERG